MNEQRIYDVILGPLTTEKSVRISDRHRQIAFKVAKDATKCLVKQAVSKLFSVEVTGVQMVRLKGKNKQFRQRSGRRSDWKKAYVSLAEGHDINFANFQ